MRAPGFWGNPPAAPGWQAWLLAPLAAVWAFAARRRSARPGQRLAVPVICVGNLTAGGAGKTPTAIALALRLQGRGVRVMIVSRGYGGRLEGPVRVDPGRHRAADVGDEPLLLAAFAPVWVGRDRAAAAAAAVADGAEAVVLDDGFQNPALVRDLSILVVDAGFGFGNGRVIPAGPLREPLAEGLARADLLLAIGTPEERARLAAAWPQLAAHPASGSHADAADDALPRAMATQSAAPQLAAAPRSAEPPTAARGFAEPYVAAARAAPAPAAGLAAHGGSRTTGSQPAGPQDAGPDAARLPGPGVAAERTGLPGAPAAGGPQRVAALPVLGAVLAPLATGMDWGGLRAVAFAGIGRPEKFFATLRGLGAEIVAAHGFGDHEPFAPRLLARLRAEAQARGAQLVTTEKDAARLPPGFRREVLVLPVRLVPEDWGPLDAALDRVLAPRPGR